MARSSRLPAPFAEVVESGLDPELAIAVVPTLEPHVRRQLLIQLVERAISWRSPFDDVFGQSAIARDAEGHLRAVLDRFPDAGPWSIEEARALLVQLAWSHYVTDARAAAWRAVARVTSGLDDRAIRDLQTEIETAVGAAEWSDRYQRETPISPLLVAMLAPPVPVDAVLVAVSRGDPFGAALRVMLRSAELEPRAIERFIGLCRRAGRDGARDRWRDELADVVGRPSECRDAGRFVDVVTTGILGHRVPLGNLPFSGDNELLAAGACAILGMLAAAPGAGSRRADAIPELQALVIWGGQWSGNRPRSNPVARAAVAGLVAIGDDRAIAALRAAQERVGQRAGLAKPLAAAIDGLLERSDRSLVEIVAGSGPMFDLDPSARRTWATSAGLVELVVDGGAVTVSSPDESAGGDVAAALAEARSVGDAVEKEIRRIGDRTDCSLRDRATFTPAELAAFTAGSPLQTSVSSGLVWQLRIADAWVAARQDGGRWVAVDGRRIAASSDQARLWHPADATPDDLDAWRDHAIQQRVRQPVRQVFREVYADPDEIPLGAPLRMRKAEALLRLRGWRMTGLGGWDGGERATATRTDPVTGGRAEVVVDAGHTLVAATHGAWCVLDESSLVLPPATPDFVVFRSEVLRDLDLVVTAAAATARDVARSDPAFHGAMSPFAEQPLRGAGSVRADVLRRLGAAGMLPDTIGVDGAFLVAHRPSGPMRIHLGTSIVVGADGAMRMLGNVRIGPDVPWLPIEHDGTLARMLAFAVRTRG